MTGGAEEETAEEDESATDGTEEDESMQPGAGGADEDSTGEDESQISGTLEDTGADGEIPKDGGEGLGDGDELPPDTGLPELEELNALPPMLYTSGTGSDKTSLITVESVKVLQDNAEVSPGGTLDGTKDITLTYVLSAPVQNDDGIDASQTDTYIAKGDYGTITFPEGLALPGTMNGHTQSFFMNGVELGTQEFTAGSPSGATLTFTGDVIDTWKDLTFGFRLSFQCSHEGGFADRDYDVRIGGKDYTIHVPKRETVLSGSKSGKADIGAKKITWTVKVTPELGSVGSGDDGNLYGMTFSDDLSSVGAYVTGSFKIGTSDDYAAATAVEDSKLNLGGSGGTGGTGNAISYAFEEDAADSGECVGTKYLFFRTEIPDKMIGDGKGTVTNQAEVKTADKTVLGGDDLKAEVKIEIKRIEKTGLHQYEGDTGLAYDPSQDFIYWSILVNPGKETLQEAKLVDVLPKELTFVSATIQKRKSDDSGWDSEVAVADDKITKETVTEGGVSREKLTVNVCNTGSGTSAALNEYILLKLKTKLNSTLESTGQHHAYSVDNQAELHYVYKGEGVTAASNRTGKVGIGNASIVKSGEGYDAASHTVTWKVTVNTGKKEVTGMRTVDLLVYGGSKPDFDAITIDPAAAAGAAGTLNGLTKEDLQKLTPGYYQKLTGTPAAVDGASLTFTRYTLKASDGRAVADVLVTTGADGNAGIASDRAVSYTMQTIVTNPACYAANKSTDIKNTAALFNENTMIGNTTATQKIVSHMIEKDTLNVTDATAIAAATSASAASGVTNANGAATPSYDYEKNETVFRLHVNANGLTDATADITTADGETVGNIPLVDKLPQGWEFQDIVPGQKFLLYSGRPGSNGKTVEAETLVATSEYDAIFTADGKGAVSTSGSGVSVQQEMRFVFQKLEKPYVILVKAGPTKAAIEQYFGTNHTTKIKNTAFLENDKLKGTDYPSDYEEVSIQSSVLNKTMINSMAKGGYVEWTVNYQPYAAGRAGSVLTDTIPDGAELRMTNTGALDYMGIVDGKRNFTVTRRSLKPDGAYEDDDSLNEAAMKQCLTYSSQTRKLTFTPPDSGQAYRITYITDVTAANGSKLNNKVELASSNLSAESSSQEVSVLSVDMAGMMTRIGSLELTKENEDGEKLEGAEFSLLAKGTDKAVRTAVSDANGKVVLRGIPAGSYELLETRAPDGYIRQTRRHPVEAAKGSDGMIQVTVDGLTTTTIVNKPGSGDDAPPVIPDKSDGSSSDGKHHSSAGAQGAGNTVELTEAETSETAIPGETLPESMDIAEFVPEYSEPTAPDPNLQDSPTAIRLVDGKGNLIGVYTRTLQEDGSYSYVDRYGRRLGRNVVRTGDSMPVKAVAAVTAAALLGALLLILWKKGRFSRYYDK